MSSQEKKKITRHTELEVYQKSVAAAMKIFELGKSFPVELYKEYDSIIAMLVS